VVFSFIFNGLIDIGGFRSGRFFSLFLSC
jgi:hypothetical protein